MISVISVYGLVPFGLSSYHDVHLLLRPSRYSTVVEVSSSSSVADALLLLSRHQILSAPVRNADAPEDSSWMDRYIGLLDFSGLICCLLSKVGTVISACHRFLD